MKIEHVVSYQFLLNVCNIGCFLLKMNIEFTLECSGTNMSNPGGKRYRIERTLGEGTYGKVKLAYDNYTREKVTFSNNCRISSIYFH